MSAESLDSRKIDLSNEKLVRLETTKNNRKGNISVPETVYDPQGTSKNLKPAPEPGKKNEGCGMVLRGRLKRKQVCLVCAAHGEGTSGGWVPMVVILAEGGRLQ